MSRRETAAWLGLLLLALGLRLWRLDERAMHHDESVHGWFSSQLAREGEYHYDPVYHGPVQYYAVATAFLLAGESDLTARLPAALGGVFLVAAALLLRPRFGAGAALASGALLALSPHLLYYSRFCREDVWSLLGTAGTFLFLERWWRDRRISSLALAALAAAVAFAAKENFYVLLALLPPSVGAVLLEPGRGLDLRARLRAVSAFAASHAFVLAGAALLFFTLSELLYTVFLVHPDAGNPAWTAISYWWGQHSVERISGPKWFYLPRLVQYELAILLPAFLAIAAGWRRFGAAERFLAGWGLSSLLMYAWLGEKTPWLAVHQILPFVPLAGTAWARLVASGPVARAGGALLGTASVASALALSFAYPDLTPRRPQAESVVYVQTTPEMKELSGEILRAASAGWSPAASVEGEASWPLTWSLRDATVDWGRPSGDRLPAIVVVDPGAAEEVAASLGPSWGREAVPLRAWWLPEVSARPLKPSPGELLEYLATRRPWSPIGWQEVIVFRHPGYHPGVAP